MPSPARILLGIALVGLAATVASAWTCAYFSSVPSDCGVPRVTMEDARWYGIVPPGWPDRPTWRKTRTTALVTVLDLQAPLRPGDSQTGFQQQARLYGFPFAAMRTEHATGAPASWRGGLGQGSRGKGAFPLLPEWRGLVLDTLVFGSVAAGLVGVAGVVSRRRVLARIGRGQCTVCRHLLTPQTSRCPECGTDAAAASA